MMTSLSRDLILFCAVAALAGCQKQEPDGFSYSRSSPAWSPTGNLVAYCYGGDQWGRETAGIFLFDLRDSSVRVLVPSKPMPLPDAPDFSPDGEWIVFHSGGLIWKVRVNGDDLLQLTSSDEGYCPSWSPNGQEIAYSAICPAEASGIWIIAPDGSNRRHIGLAYHPDWSPLGGRFAYIGGPGTTEAESQIWTADTDGSNTTQLTFDGSAVSNREPSFSPDGSRIAYSSARNPVGPDIRVMNSDGSNAKRLAEGGDQPCWSPDGSRILYTNIRRGEIWIMNSDGSKQARLISGE